ncbi:MAG: methyltransferase domain-containing protein [Candidatus Cyclobacteriaceae bacterium M2_1C_046]
MKGFDLLSPVYDHLVRFIFGNAIKKATYAHLNYIRDGDNVLILGGGTGGILKGLKDKDITVTYVELSAGMLSKAKRHAVNYNVSFIQGSYSDVPDKVYDVIITPFFIDLFTTDHSRQIVSQLKTKLINGGKWIHVDFRSTLIVWQRFLIYIMYRFFRICCKIEATHLPDYGFVFTDLIKTDSKKFYHGMIESAVYKKKLLTS